MANKIPLVVDSALLRFEELQNGDTLFLANNAISGITTFTAAAVQCSTVTATTNLSCPQIVNNGQISSLLFVGNQARITGLCSANTFTGNGSGLTGVSTTINAGYGISISQTGGNYVIAYNGAGIATQAQYAYLAGISSYATLAGLATQAVTATYASNSGIATFADTANLADIANLAVVASNLTGSPNITVTNILSNLVTASNYYGDGSTLAGIPTSLVAGTGIAITFSGGTFTFTATGIATNAVYAEVAGISTVAQGLTGSPDIQVGIVSATSVTAFSYNTPSDVILKENISPLTNALDFIDNLDAVSWTWKHNRKKSNGLIAQDLALVAPEMVSNVNGILSIDYIQVIGYLIESIKELNTKVNSKS